MSYSLAIFFGLAPSIIWLLFFLRKDSHPESNKTILKIFFYGMLITLVAALVEVGFSEILLSGQRFLNIPFAVFFFLYNFVSIAFVEEFLKYLVIREKILRNPEFDEPVDAMLYMIIAGLGFAALENILVLLPREIPFLFIETASISAFRFIGATFLHALCSGLVGYFMALSIFSNKNRGRLISTGIIIASFLHGLFNVFIIKIENNLRIINGQVEIINYSTFIFSLLSLIIILGGLAFFVLWGFKKLKKLKSVCKIIETNK